VSRQARAATGRLGFEGAHKDRLALAPISMQTSPLVFRVIARRPQAPRTQFLPIRAIRVIRG